MNRPDIKTHFPEDTDVTDVVKTALDNPWYKYAGSLDNYIDYLLEKMESSQRIIIERPLPSLPEINKAAKEFERYKDTMSRAEADESVGRYWGFKQGVDWMKKRMTSP